MQAPGSLYSERGQNLEPPHQTGRRTALFRNKFKAKIGFSLSEFGPQRRMRPAAVLRGRQHAAHPQNLEAVPEGVPLQAQDQDQACRPGQLTGQRLISL